MKRRFTAALLAVLVCAQSSPTPFADERPEANPVAEILTGPETEKRFPPLAVPDGFRATLFACDPLIEYPSAIAPGPRVGSLLVAHDYLTGLGVEIVRRDEVRLIEDVDDDGYADRSTLYADGFNSIQGLAFFDGNVFVMHAPLLTRLRDTNGDGVAEQRRDLIAGLGLPPEENSNRLHCANGVVAGHDGWLYLALGDRGCDVRRPEGNRLLFQQGGILRCRMDGSDLHIFSTGLRNIYDVALDEELNVFVRDNENDGGDYMIRVCHCFSGSDHGYPYHYYERPDEIMPPLADLGRGSSAGGTSYLETAFPAEYRRSLFFCEWGRAVVRYERSRRSSSFDAMKEIDFAVGAQDDPYGFKPTDLVVDYDGSLLVSDWCDGQRPKRGRGRIYRVSTTAPKASGGGASNPADSSLADLIKQLGAAEHSRRVAAQLEILRRGLPAVVAVETALKSRELNGLARLHAVWVIASFADRSVPDTLFRLAAEDPEVRVRAQAVRAIGDLSDPILVNDRIDGRRGDDNVAERIAELAKNADPRVLLEAVIVLRRLRWPGTPEWLAANLSQSDPAIDHAASQAIRHAGNWPAALELLDGPPHLRRLALHAVAEQRDPYLADDLISRLEQDEEPERRREYADSLTRIVRKLEPWTYWGFRPDPRPAARVDWEKTAAITSALNLLLSDADLDTRAFVLNRMLRENVEPEFTRLANWLRSDADEQRVGAILDSLRLHDTPRTRLLLTETTLRKELSVSARLKALSMLLDHPGDATTMTSLAGKLEDGAVLAELLRAFGRRQDVQADELLLAKLDSSSAEVRAAAMQSLGSRGSKSSLPHVKRLLNDFDSRVRLAAAVTAGQLGAGDCRDALLELAAGDASAVIAASLVSLRQLRDSRAAEQAAAALSDRDAQIAAIDYLREYGSPHVLDAVVQAAILNPSSGFQAAIAEALAKWRGDFPDARRDVDQAIAAVHGQSGQPLLWSVIGPLSDVQADELMEELRQQNHWGVGTVDTLTVAKGTPPQLSFKKATHDGSVWIASTPVRFEDATNIELLTAGTGRLSVWAAGERIHSRKNSGAFRPDSDRIAARLNDDTSLLVARIQPGAGESGRFQLRFRRRSSKAEHERLVSFALQSRGNVNRGREVFGNAEKSACVRCHRLGAEGGRIGPDLTGIGSRFSRIHLIESILEPSRTVAPSYATIVVLRKDGTVHSGIRVSETDQVLVLGDNKGELHEIDKSAVDVVTTQSASTMPDGLERRLTDREFADLLAFLESQKVAPEE